MALSVCITYLTSYMVMTRYCPTSAMRSLYVILALVGFVGSQSPAVFDHLISRVQVKALEANGANLDKLDAHTQLKVFFYTWLTMERAEGGYVTYNKYKCMSSMVCTLPKPCRH